MWNRCASGIATEVQYNVQFADAIAVLQLELQLVHALSLVVVLAYHAPNRHSKSYFTGSEAASPIAGLG